MKPDIKPWPLKSMHGIQNRIKTNPVFQRPAVWGLAQKQLRRKIFLGLWIIVITGFVSGCGTLNIPPAFRFRALNEQAGVANKSIVVVPYKGPSLALTNMHTATFVLGGIVASTIEHAATESRRMTMSEQLNTTTVAFVPERIFAEECVAALRNSAHGEGLPAILLSDPVTLPDARPLIDSEPHPFKPEFVNWNQWIATYNQWWSSNPKDNLSAIEAPLNQSFILEFLFRAPYLNNGKGLYIFAGIRLVNPVSGEILAADGLAAELCTVHPLTSVDGMDQFVEDFRGCARGIIEKSLKKMKIN
ncbi:MAG: hypothetical protein WA610_05460 [Thermodesulfovibrionales bacterium]